MNPGAQARERLNLGKKRKFSGVRLTIRFVDRHGTLVAGTPAMTTTSRALIAFLASFAAAVPAAAQGPPFRRYLAEGATGPFFATRLSLANPDGVNPANVVLTFDSGSGTRRTLPLSLVPGGTAFVDIGAISGFEASDVSTTIESDRLVVVDRMMEWGIDPATGHGYGSSLETATAASSTTWFLAEGSTVLGFDLYYLLQNPQPTIANVTVRYLLSSGTVITRTYGMAPHSRTTIYVNVIPGIEETDVSGDITANVPIIVERAMYRNTPGQYYGLGTVSMGVTAPATRWFLAEGATGTFFDLYVLFANPSATDAHITAEYAKEDGTVITRNYVVGAHTRFSVYVDSIPGLDGHIGRDHRDLDQQRADRGRAGDVLAGQLLRLLRRAHVGRHDRDRPALGDRERRRRSRHPDVRAAGEHRQSARDRRSSASCRHPGSTRACGVS